MYFGFVGAERFGDWHFEGEVVFEDYCFEERVFEEGVGSGRRLRRIEDLRS